MKQQVVLQDLAFTAEDSSSNETLSGSKVHSKGHLWHLLTWLYVEESTSKHLVPAEPLHPASSNRHPAKSRFLTTRRAWLANAILTCHGLATLKGSPPKCRYQFHRRRIGLCWASYSWSPAAQNLRIWRRILWTHSISHDVFHYHACLVLCLLTFLFALSEHTLNAHNQSTYGTCCEQGNSWTTITALPTKMEKLWGQHLLQIINVLQLLTFQRTCPTLLMSEAKQTLKLLAVPLSFSFTWVALPANSKPPAPSCANSHQNSNTVYVGATCLCVPKCKAKEHKRNITKAFKDYLAKEGCLEDPFFSTNL